VCIRLGLELQAGSTCGIGQCFDTTVVSETCAVEGNFLNAGSFGFFSNTLAHHFGSSLVAAFASCA
jgi:hypothetical protein